MTNLGLSLFRKRQAENLRTISLDRLRPHHVALAGTKAVALGRMKRAGLAVPPGFVLPATAFRMFLNSIPGWARLEMALSTLDASDLERISALSEQMLDTLSNQSSPKVVDLVIDTTLAQYPGVRLWAVRSSATIEDLPDASFAGQHESFLQIRREDVALRVRDCWLSFYSPRAIAYRIHHGLVHDRAAMAVIIQEMVDAEAAGVLFTADPVTHYRSRIIIEAAAGLGEKVVSGRTVPERIVLNRSSLRILRRTPDNHVNAAGVNRCVLDDLQARKLARLSQRVERLIKGPLDIEWAMAKNTCYVLQARAMTSKPYVKTWDEKQVWSNLNTGEVLPDVTTPATWSMLQLFLGHLGQSVFKLLGANIHGAPLIGRVAGRGYFNANTGLAAMKPFAFLIHHIPNLAQALGGGQIDWHEQGLLYIPEEDLPNLGFSWPRYILSWPGIIRDLITHSPHRADQWTVKLKARNDALARLNLEAMSTAELVDRFDQMLQDGFKGWDLLYLGTQGAALPVFQKACRDWLHDPQLSLGYRLFTALGEIPEAKAGLSLWHLAMLARANPELERIMLTSDGWPQASIQLEASAHGRHFLQEWKAFMSEHGHHCRGEIELFNARWSETPEYILGVVRGYMQSMGQPPSDSSVTHNPLAAQDRLARERERLVEHCRQQLRNPIKRWIFLRSLRRAQKLAINREEWKNQAIRLITFMRQLLKILGHRLCAGGVLPCADDIFFLEVHEIAPVANGGADFDAKPLIKKRRLEYESNARLNPPCVVIGQFNPHDQPASLRAASNHVLTGIPVFPGIVSGLARVILRTDVRDQVKTGEILVAPFTDPAWTPYFIPAAGVVIDQGGILSHGSIVAREYGLPTVTNVGRATQVIKTGDLIQVDGTLGQVTVLGRAGDTTGRLPKDCHPIE